MKIFVPIKRVLDYNLRPLVKSDGSGIDLSNVKMSMNPFDEIAVEQAVRLKEQGQASEVIAISIGDKKAPDTLRTALAMGADSAVHILHEDIIEPLAVAKILQKLCEDHKPDLVICGKQSIDDDYNQTGQMLAGLMNWPQACFASKVEVLDKTLNVTREIDGGLQTISVHLPAVITTDLRLNEPRYASLPNIMKAKRKPLETIQVVDLGLDITPRLEAVKTNEPPKRSAGKIVETVEELVTYLKNDGLI